MTDSTKSKKNISPLAAGAAAGAIIGVATGAAVVALSDKNNRKKVEKTMKDMRIWGDKKVSEIKSQVGNTQKDMSEKADSVKKDLTEEVGQVKKTQSSATPTRSTQSHA